LLIKNVYSIARLCWHGMTINFSFWKEYQPSHYKTFNSSACPLHLLHIYNLFRVFASLP
jgi:hypothetical protein